jgi:hypothetical protein
MRDLVDVDYPGADRVRVVMDNLSTHTTSAIYQTFTTAEARRVVRRLEFHYTPRHASWLNMAEIEIGVMRRQCLDRRIDNATCSNPRLTPGSDGEPRAVLKSDGCSRPTWPVKKWPSLIQRHRSKNHNLWGGCSTTIMPISAPRCLEPAASLCSVVGDDAKGSHRGRLVLEGDCSNLLRHDDHNVEIANLQKIGPPCGEPVTARFPLALLTVPVATATIGDIDRVAALALLDMPAHPSGPAHLDRAHNPASDTSEMSVVCLTISFFRGGERCALF